jgi:hypothetical protein
VGNKGFSTKACSKPTYRVSIPRGHVMTVFGRCKLWIIAPSLWIVQGLICNGQPRQCFYIHAATMVVFIVIHLKLNLVSSIWTSRREKGYERFFNFYFLRQRNFHMRVYFKRFLGKLSKPMKVCGHPGIWTRDLLHWSPRC